jgi:hypothetical protein
MQLSFNIPLVLGLFVLTPPCQYTPLLIYSLFTPSHILFNALWLAALCYTNPLFLRGILFLIYTHFLKTQLGHKTRDWCNDFSFQL